MTEPYKISRTAPNTYALVDRETGSEVGTIQRGIGRDANTWSGYDLAGRRIVGPYPGSRATAAANTYRELNPKE